ASARAATDVADPVDLGRRDRDEGRVRKAREAARDLGLAHAGGPDHQDVLGRDLVAQRLAALLATPAVPQRDRDRALCLALPNDELVQFMDNFLGGHAAHSSTSMERW